ncbi:MAG: methenyltetrahydromethanopterin cyclohydrolase, partial [Tepidimonas ignava]
PPPPVVVDKLLRDCRLAPEALAIVLTPTTSLAGTTQVVARVLEVALHRAHELKFPLEHIVDGSACAPLPAPCADGVQAMGRTNDAILYGGQVRLTVSGDADAARELARRLPSSTSRDYGRSFADLFAAAGYDFYQLDGALFAPAEVWVSHLESGRTWHAGHTNLDLLHRLWREDA